MRRNGWRAGPVLSLWGVLAGAAQAQAVDNGSMGPPAPASDRVLFAHFTPEQFADLAPAGSSVRTALAPGGQAVAIADTWRAHPSGVIERLSLEREGELVRADGAPLPPRAGDPARLETQRYELSYTRGWRAPPIEAGGLEISVTPHAGFGVGSEGVSPRAGATVTIAERLEGLAPDGREAFGDRGRWYLFAAGEGRAVGYNFARNRDGDFVRSGLSQDRGSFIGDAQVGVAWRRGDLQASFGYVYREHEVSELRPSEGLDRDVSEGLVAFQLSIKPDW